MSAPVEIVGRDGQVCKVTKRGEIVVAPVSYSKSYQTSRNTAGTSNIITGLANKSFLITSMLIGSDKTNVDTTVDIFESNDADSAIQSKLIISLGVGKNDRLIATGLQIETDVTKWVNFTMDTSALISITFGGYYLDS